MFNGQSVAEMEVNRFRIVFIKKRCC